MNAAEGALLASGIVVIVTFFSRQLGTGVSRSFFIIFAPLVFVSLGLARCVSVAAAMVAERHWPSPIRAALLGDGSHAGRLVSLMNSANVASVIKGLITTEGHTAEGLSLCVPILGTTGQLAEVINREHLNRIILLNGSISPGELDECKRVFTRMGVIVNCTVDFAPERGRVNVVNQYGLPLVELRPLAFTKGQEMVKRGFDIVASALALILLGPAMLAIAALIKFTSEGPILYKAPRVGRGGRHFMFLKCIRLSNAPFVQLRSVLNLSDERSRNSTEAAESGRSGEAGWGVRSQRFDPGWVLSAAWLVGSGAG